MAVQWQERTVALKDLKPYERNPRKISKEAFAHLKRSMAEDGYHGRLLCTPDNRVIGGHQRLKVMKELGWKDCAVLMPDRELTEDEYRRLLIRDNLQAGEWDMDMLANDFEPQELLDWGFPENLLPKQEGVVNEPEGDEDEAPEAPAVPQTVRGDLYEIGPHRLLCGDSTLIDDVDKLMDGAKADMVFTDPPYNVDYSNQDRPKAGNIDHGKILNDVMDVDEFTRFLCDVYLSLDCVTKDNVAAYIWYADKMTVPFLSALSGTGFQFAQTLIWKKPMLLGRSRYQWAHEPCIFAVKGSPYHTEDRTKTTVWDCGGYDKSKNVHPTQKPVFLREEAINNSSKKGQVIIDLFGGSGSTMVAAHKLGRTAYLMELDEKYCDVIVQRMHKLFPDLPIKRNGQPFSVEATLDA